MSLCQQSALYAAEQPLPRALGLRALTLLEAQALVDGWRELPWWTQNFPGLEYVEVRRLRSSSAGSVGGLSDDPRVAICEMAPIHMNTLILAHEVSHPLTETRYGRGDHSPWFARTYLQLSFYALGSDGYKQLYDALEAANIDHRIDE